jgi:hypothetical protein
MQKLFVLNSPFMQRRRQAFCQSNTRGRRGRRGADSRMPAAMAFSRPPGATGTGVDLRFPAAPERIRHVPLGAVCATAPCLQ